MATSQFRNPLVMQILEKMFTDLEKRDEFDAETLHQLKRLAAKGQLAKAARVTRVIKRTSGGGKS